MATASDIEREIELLQIELIELSKPIAPTTPLPPLPIGPNLARGPDEMWHVYMHRLSEYNSLNNLPSETEFLYELTDTVDYQCKIQQRLQQLKDKETNVHPYLELPLTTVPPLYWDQKVEKAKIIAQHLLAEEAAPSTRYQDTEVLIKDLQKRLMCLEEQYLHM